MPDDAAADLSRRVSTAISLMPGADGEDKMGLHARWLLGEVMRQVKPSDLVPEEVMGFLAILAPAHNRKLALTGNPRAIPLVFVDPETGRRWDFQDNRLD